VVTSQDSAVGRRDLEADWMQIGRHLILKHRHKPYVNAELFEDYLRSVFLPHLMIIPIAKDLSEEDAVFLTDNCSSYLTSVRLSSNFSPLPLCAWLSFWLWLLSHRIPDIPQSFQILDLTLFGVLKRRGQYQLRLEDDAESADSSGRCITTPGCR
jgi:hypothetical protein